MVLYNYHVNNRFGPLINHWTTRFEAKHKYFKHLANVLGNFINICFSLALRHQLRQCYLSLNSILTLPGEDVEIGPGNSGTIFYISLLLLINFIVDKFCCDVNLISLCNHV